MGKKYKDIKIGDVFGRWTVIDTFILKKVSRKNRRFWKCQCNCENKTIKYVIEYALINETSTSCGCYRKEKLTKNKDCKVRKKIDKNRSLASSKLNILDIWSEKNVKNPNEYYLHSSKNVWWKCQNKLHKDYLREINTSVKLDFRCPECVRERDESFLQEKVRKFLNDKGYKLNHEYNCSLVPTNPKNKHKLPFDNEVIDLKLIIEVHGVQHYDLNTYTHGHWKSEIITPQQALYKRKLYDRYKKYIAWNKGYEYLEIPYWTEKDNSYKTLIDEKINEILVKQKESA